jgi:poly-gamma-glutamate synthesis protein (capsule biosynthesis protein)
MVLLVCVACRRETAGDAALEGKPASTVSVTLRDGGSAPERAFVEKALSEAAETLGIRLTDGGEEGAIVIDFLSSWEFEHEWGDIPLSKTWYVPVVEKIEKIENKPDVSRESCLQGGLISLNELSPPFVAARVDGLSVSDKDYPLVKVIGIRLRYEGDGEEGEKGEKLHAYLRDLPKAAEAPSLVWLAAAGDLMLGRGAEEILLQRGPSALFGGAAEILANADIALVNMEGPISSRGAKVPKTFNFRFTPAAAQALADAGIDAVLFANNHVYDYGEEAFTDSLSLLKSAGIGVLGAGLNDDEAKLPWVFSKGGFSARLFGIASFPRESSGWDGASIAAGVGKAGLLHAARGGAEQLKAAFDTGALNIVFFHGGEEWSRSPDKGTRDLYTGLIDSGADLIIGSHPHLVQDFEWVHGVPVFWSLGNFVFAGMEETGGGDRGLLIRLAYFGKTLVYLERFPLILTGPTTGVAGSK